MSDQVEQLEIEVSELSKALFRSQRNAQQSQALLQQFATQVADLLEVSEEQRVDLKIQDLIGILATKLDKTDPNDNAEISE